MGHSFDIPPSLNATCHTVSSFPPVQWMSHPYLLDIPNTIHRFIRHSCTYAACMSPTLNKRSALKCFKCSNVIEIWNWKLFNFYPGLPHVHSHFFKYTLLNVKSKKWNLQIGNWQSGKLLSLLAHKTLVDQCKQSLKLKLITGLHYEVSVFWPSPVI